MSDATWTTTQLLGLAPDPLLARAAERLAAPQQWRDLGRAPGRAWGRFPNGSNPPLQVQVTLPDLTLRCSCAARKRPCRHALALALLYHDDRAAFAPAADPPAWVGRAAPDAAAAPDRQTARAAYQRRLAALQAGQAHLAAWLRDMLHSGLAGLPERPASYWQEMSGRLADAHAPRSAAAVRELGRLPARRPDWPEQLLRRAGRLYLQTQGFARYAALGPDAQADLRAAAGWFADPDHPGDDRVRGQWQILAAAAEQESGEHRLQTWLYDPRTRRYAFIEREPRDLQHQPSLPIGATAVATLRFSPGSWPQRAALDALHEITPRTTAVPAHARLPAARAAYGKALALNPWLARFPLVLQGMTAHLDDEQWELRDDDGYRLPLPQPFLYGWHLQAFGSDPDARLFGLWDGAAFTPLGVSGRDGWLALGALRGQK